MQGLATITQDPWAAREAQYDQLEGLEDRLRFVLNYAVLAPSRLNTQPWLFAVSTDRVELYADRRRALAVADPNDRQMLLACGGALEYLSIAMRRFGTEPVIRIFPDLDRPDLLATVKAGPVVRPTEATITAFQAIQRRRTRFSGLDARPVPSGVVADLKGRTESGRACVVFPGDPHRMTLADIVKEAMAVRASDQRFRRELDSWTHPSRRDSRDGIPTTSGTGGPSRGRDGLVSEGPPFLAVVLSRNDSHACWLRAGRVLARLLLAATEHGLVARCLNHPLEIPALRDRVTNLIAQGRAVQAVVRLGYSDSVRLIPRRPVRDVLLAGS